METRRERRENAGKKKIIIAVAVGAAVVIAIVVGIFVLRDAWEKQQHQALLDKYPLRYADLIEKYAGEFGLEEAFVAAVIFCESSYNPNAVSSDDARGLMQILPSTGEWLAGKFGEQAEYDPQQLFDPETNIRYACWYFNYLTERFSGDIVKIIAAYHSGQGTIDRYLQDPEISPDGNTLTNLPEGSNVAKYVSHVQAVRQIYIDLYYTPEASE